MKKIKENVINEVCPNCVEALTYQKKKIGLGLNWLICGTCGYREHKVHATVKAVEVSNFVQRIRFNNANNRRVLKE